MKKLYRTIPTTFILLAVIFCGVYYLAINGEAYKYSVGYIKQNKRLEEIIGKINRQHLSYLGPYSVTTNGKEGCAKYSIVVEGQKEKGTVMLILKQQNGKWEVTEGNLTYQGDKVLSVN